MSLSTLVLYGRQYLDELDEIMLTAFVRLSQAPVVALGGVVSMGAFIAACSPGQDLETRMALASIAVAGGRFAHGQPSKLGSLLGYAALATHAVYGYLANDLSIAMPSIVTLGVTELYVKDRKPRDLPPAGPDDPDSDLDGDQGRPPTTPILPPGPRGGHRPRHDYRDRRPTSSLYGPRTPQRDPRRHAVSRGE